MSKIVLSDWTLDVDGGSISVKVPGDVINDLTQSGIIEDCLYGDNYKKALWVHDRDWLYSVNFELSEEDLKEETLTVTFDSVDTFSEVYLNGKEVGKTDNMFRSFTFDIKSAAVKGVNRLSVKLISIRKKEKELHNDKYFACFSTDRIFIRKPQCHFGWDWAPNFPGTGICGRVTVCASPRGKISGVQILTDNSGAASFIVETDYNNRNPGEKKIEGDEIVVKTERAPGFGLNNAIEKKAIVFGDKNLLNLYVDDVELWYPNGYGDQPLYAYEISLVRNGVTIDRKTGKYAFRKLEVRETPCGDRRRFDIYCNDTRIRVIGSNWVPASMFTGLIDHDRYRKLLRIAKNAGFDMLRVWGGGLYEKDDFYDLCDEYGIMIWQDFMFSCSIIPDDQHWFEQALEPELREQIMRLRNHPSIALWCGGNEMTNCFRYSYPGYGMHVSHVILPGLCYELDGTRKYVWDSPYSCTGIGNDVTSGDCHNATLTGATVEDMLAYREQQWGKENNFDTECAVLGMCRPRSFRKFMPKDKIWPQNEVWEDRLSCNPYDEYIASFTERINLSVNALFGGYDDFYDYTKKSMTVHAEVLKDEIKYYRSFEFNTGLMNWMFNDIWGNSTWAVVDYYLEKKPAYYAMKRAGRRQGLGIVYRKDGYFISVVNDCKTEWSGNLRFSHRSLDGKIYDRSERTITLPPFTQQNIPISFDKTIADSFLYVEFGGECDVYFYDMWKDKRFRTDLSVDKKVKGNVADVTVKANEFARMVFIDLPDGVLCDMEDNYFDLPKGEQKTVRIVADREIAERDITVRTFADEWSE